MTPITQDDVFLDWYTSESNRHIPGLAQHMPGRTPAEVANVGLRLIRGPLLKHKVQAQGPNIPTILFFDVYNVAWFATDVSLADLGNAKAMQWTGQPFDTVGDVATQHSDFKNCSVNLKHRATLVGKAPGAELYLIDGYHRAAGAIRAGIPSLIPAFVGYHPAMDHWAWYR